MNQSGLAMLTDDNRLAYAGEDYEKVLIRVGRIAKWSFTWLSQKGSAMYKFRLGDVPVECETLDELKAAVAIQSLRVSDLQGPPETETPRRKRSFKKSPGSGTKRLWDMAAWYGPRIGKSRDEARKSLTRMRKESLGEFHSLCQEFERQSTQTITAINSNTGRP